MQKESLSRLARAPRIEILKDRGIVEWGPEELEWGDEGRCGVWEVARGPRQAWQVAAEPLHTSAVLAVS